MGIIERKEREKQKRRKAILIAAERIFFSKNGDKRTMDDVAARVELSKGTLYLYFKNKNDLLYGIAERGVVILNGYFAKINKKLSGKDQLSELGDEFVRFVEDYPKHFELILRFELMVLTPSEIKSSLLMNSPLSILQEILIKGQKDGSIRNDLTVNDLVVILWSQILGLLQSLLHKEKYIEAYEVDFKSIIKGHYRIIMKGVSP